MQSFPSELVGQVFDNLTSSPSTLANVASSHSSLQHEAERVLYTTVSLAKPHKLECFLQSLNTKERGEARRRAVCELILSDMRRSIQTVHKILLLLDNLRHLSMLGGLDGGATLMAEQSYGFQLKSFRLPAGHVPKDISAFLTSQPSLQRLTLPVFDLISEPKIPSDALPNLECATLPAQMASQVVAGRPVTSIMTRVWDVEVAKDLGKALAVSETPLRSLNIMVDTLAQELLAPLAPSLREAVELQIIEWFPLDQTDPFGWLRGLSGCTKLRRISILRSSASASSQTLCRDEQSGGAWVTNNLEAN